MKKPKITRVTLAELRAKPPRFTPEERARLKAMTEDEIEQNALDDPDNPPLTDTQLDRAATGRRVRLLRTRLGLSQSKFAAQFRIPVGTLRDWENGRRKPDAPALAYITVIERETNAVTRALKA